MKKIQRLFKFSIFFPIFLLLCGYTSPVNSAQYKETKPDARPERGVARWISKSLKGRPTASGEPHDYNDLIAAHKTLPFNTYVHILNRDNGKTVIVRINDRISHKSDNILLVSWRAAKMLGMLDSGKAEVEIKPIKMQTGTASWYGKKFHGRQTANGEVYDMNQMTAAHKTLPFNTQVRVINLNNKRSIIVRINDRGPFVKGRIIDLSRKAAMEIGMINAGTAKVRLEILPPRSKDGIDG